MRAFCTLQKLPVCENAIDTIITQACLDSCVNASTSTVDMLPDGRRRVVATFTNLVEDRKYSASIYVQVNGGGLIQQSPSVKISEWCDTYLVNVPYLFPIIATFDVYSVTVNGSVVNGRVCLTVEYVEGHEPNPHCYVVFRSTITGHDMYHATIQGSSMCIPNVPAHPSYTIIATDGDAVDEINTTAPVTILRVVVPEYTVILSSSTSPRATPTPTPTGLSLQYTTFIFFTFYCRIDNYRRIFISDSSDCPTSIW